MTQAEFSNWFLSGTVAVNGFVRPADSVTFQGGTNCDFFKWSVRMFLWATSPTPPNYHGGGGHVFNSGTFFGVSVPDANQKRTLIPNVTGRTPILPVFTTQLGARGKPTARNIAGLMVDVERPQVGPTGRTIIRNKAGENIEIARTQIGKDGNPIFFDKSGKAINVQLSKTGKPFVFDTSGKPIEIQSAKIGPNGRTIFQTASGTVIDIEQAEAGGGILMATTGSLVYYQMSVDDMFAYFATCNKTSNCPFPAGSSTQFPNVFPTTAQDLNQIVNFAQNVKGHPIPDPNVLTIEVKTAWVETTGLDVSKYITMTATIPDYNRNSSSLWTLNGTKTVQLALVGFHLVGAVAGHPEMIWATFEHIDNAPNDAYAYNATVNNQTVTIAKARDTAVPAGQGTLAGNWLFSANHSQGGFNNQLIVASGTNIAAFTSLPIGASDTLRINAWGTPASAGNAANLNTQIIAINNNLRAMLAAGDPRMNYMFTGATWTFGGAPTGTNQVGTNQVANTSMETYKQGQNCFSCHAGNMLGTFPNGGLSHIYAPLQPLP